MARLKFDLGLVLELMKNCIFIVLSLLTLNFAAFSNDDQVWSKGCSALLSAISRGEADKIDVFVTLITAPRVGFMPLTVEGRETVHDMVGDYGKMVLVFPSEESRSRGRVKIEAKQRLLLAGTIKPANDKLWLIPGGGRGSSALPRAFILNNNQITVTDHDGHLIRKRPLNPDIKLYFRPPTDLKGPQYRELFPISGETLPGRVKDFGTLVELVRAAKLDGELEASSFRSAGSADIKEFRQNRIYLLQDILRESLFAQYTLIRLVAHVFLPYSTPDIQLRAFEVLTTEGWRRIILSKKTFSELKVVSSANFKANDS